MKLAESEDTLAQNKLLILYILNKVNKPLNSEELLKLVLSITDMNYFYFKQFLLDLLEKKYILNYTSEENKSLYIMTEEGKNVLTLTENIIPGILKLKVDSKFKDNLLEMKEEFSVIAEFTPDSKNGYFVKCKLVEENKDLVDFSLYVATREQAVNIVNNWKKNANIIYPELFNILTKNNE